MECTVCQGAHNDELHQSTRRLRQWLIRGLDAAPPPVIGSGSANAIQCARIFRRRLTSPAPNAAVSSSAMLEGSGTAAGAVVRLSTAL
jgi:hypothetical protein